MIQCRKVFPGTWADPVGMDLAVMTEDAIKGLQGEVPATSFAFKVIQEANRLNIVLKGRKVMEAAEIRQEIFTIMTKGGMANIMA
jgi:hypothetical protein